MRVFVFLLEEKVHWKADRNSLTTKLEQWRDWGEGSDKNSHCQSRRSYQRAIFGGHYSWWIQGAAMLEAQPPCQDIMGQSHDTAVVLACSITHYGSLAKRHVWTLKSRTKVFGISLHFADVNSFGWKWASLGNPHITTQSMGNRFQLWPFDSRAQDESSCARPLQRCWVNCPKTDSRMPNWTWLSTSASIFERSTMKSK